MIDIDLFLCDKCGTCISVCPVDAILLEDLLKIDSEKCISCGKCIKVCPSGALKFPPDKS
jgi:ferredoxin